MPSSAFAESDTSVSRRRFTAASQLARRGVAAVAIAAILTPASAFAIEMFTFFGDGSRVPLPSLETPIEAYPGIPLRSDRLRARRRSMRASPNGEAGRTLAATSGPDPSERLACRRNNRAPRS